MTDKERYVNVAELKIKVRHWAKTRGMSNIALQNFTDMIKSLPVTVKGDLETTLEGEEIVKHGHLIDLPRALDPSERPVKCSVCETVTSLYHGYKPRYCSNCGAKFDEENKDMLNEKPSGNFCKAHGCSLETRQSCCGCAAYLENYSKWLAAQMEPDGGDKHD